VRTFRALRRLRIPADFYFDVLEAGARVGLEEDVVDVLLNGVGVVDEEPRDSSPAGEGADTLEGDPEGAEVDGDGGGGGHGKSRGDEEGRGLGRDAHPALCMWCVCVWSLARSKARER
jgi:hypothetical protein